MEKLNLGDDFTKDGENPGGEGEGEGEGAEKIEGEEESPEDGEEGEEEGDEGGEGGNGGESGEDGEEPTLEDKQKELQGLLDTEKSLDTDLSTIDEQIAAARKRISDKRSKRREGRELAETVNEAVPGEDDGEQDDLADIDPETLKVLERFTKAKGLVPKSELGKMSYQNAHKASEDNFYQTHPEYLPENDTDDALYNALKEELSYFAAPKDPKKIPELFEKAHKHVMEKYPDKFKTKQPENKVVTKEVKKSSVIVKKAGVGGGTGGGAAGGGQKKGDGGGTKSFSDKQLSALRDGGWTEDEIKELTS